MRSNPWLRRCTVGLVLFGAGCGVDSWGDGGDGGGLGPQQRLEFIVLTEEIELIGGGASSTRYLMSVGSLGTADAIATPGGSATVTIGNPSVLAITRRDNGSVEFRAVATGTTQLTASGNGFTKSATVEVPIEPLPIDKLQVVSSWAFPPRIEFPDAEGNLAEAVVSLQQSFALQFYVRRNGHTLSAIPFTLEPAAPGIVQLTTHCRPVDIDPHCDVYAQWGWITGRALGVTVVTVTVRNKHLPILVHVVQP